MAEVIRQHDEALVTEPVEEGPELAAVPLAK